MLYRKAPPQPTRLLLRVVAVAGSGALLAAAACSSSSSEGSVPIAGTVDGGSDQHVVTGVMPNPDGGDEHVVSGLVDGSTFDGPVGIIVHPDAGQD